MNLRRTIGLLIPDTRFERHAAAWILFVICTSALYTIGENPGRFMEFVDDYLLSMPVILALTYLTVYWLIPAFLLKGKTYLFIVLFVILLLLSGILEHLKTQLLLLPLIRPEIQHNFTFSIFSISRGTFFILIPSIYFITLKYTRDWYNIKVLKTEEEKKHIKNELSFLKSQIHPNFLLITLGNLEIIAKQKPEAAAEGIEKISELLNFILYECNFPKINLKKEIEQLTRFVELQMMNFRIRPEIKYSLIGTIELVYIEPLILFSILEFFFKNIDRDNAKPLKMNIFLEVFDSILNFTVDAENFLISQEEFTLDPGIDNLKKRLSLLYGKKGVVHFKNQEDNRSLIQLNLNYA